MGKTLFLLVDTETTMNDHVVDFGAMVVDRKGNILHKCAVLVSDFYGKEELFYDANSKDEIWTQRGLERRKLNYQEMLVNGHRALASVAAINTWLMRIVAKYKAIPLLTAYNLAFDLDKAKKSGIIFEPWIEQNKKFCLWHASVDLWGHSKEYKQHILYNHAFNAPTRLGNMSYKTNAEEMARFVLGQPDLDDEPHTAYEDARDYELPILIRLAEKRTVKQLLDPSRQVGYNWRNHQVREHYQPK
jgi:hypothetical protein